MARFIDELFDSLPDNFSGVFRVTSTAEVAIVRLRLRYNDRGELKMTLPPSIETGPPTIADRFFTHIVDSAWWSTQFILFSGAPGEPWDLPTTNDDSEDSASPDLRTSNIHGPGHRLKVPTCFTDFVSNGRFIDRQAGLKYVAPL